MSRPRKKPENADKQPPMMEEYEQCLVASAIIDPTILETIGQVVTKRHFVRDPTMGRLWNLLQLMRESAIPIDAKTILEWCTTHEIISGDFTKAELFKLIDSVPSAAHARYYANRVVASANRHELLSIAERLIERANDPLQDPMETARHGEALCANIGMGTEHTAVSVGQAGEELLAKLAAQAEHPDKNFSRAIYSGLFSVDQITGGTCPGEILVIGARPSDGKSSLGMQISMNAALRGTRVLYVSLEMTRIELVSRVVCGLSDVSSRDLRDGRLTADQFAQIRRAVEELNDLGVSIYDWAGATINNLVAMAKLQQNSGEGIELMVIDYFQLIINPNRHGDDWERLTEISNRLKRLARELNIPIIVLAQLNREADEKGEPQLKHLARCGALEQDADQVFLLHRLKSYEPDFSLLVAKNRNGERGKVSLFFDTKRTRFKLKDGLE